MPNVPRGREKHISGSAKDVYKRGSGLGTGPVGQGARPGQGSNSSPKRSGGGGGLKFLILIVIFLLGGGGAGLGSLMGGFSGSDSSYSTNSSQNGGYYVSQPNSSTGWIRENNTGKLDTSQVEGCRKPYTNIKGNGKDSITIMVYMCGADLESRSGMATYDLQEMANADFDDHINLIVYTGGARSWRNNIVSSRNNQIYQIKNGRIKCLQSDMGNVSMTKPETLTKFINYCAKNFPANRQELILWDHGGGSVSGYGYDEKFTSSGSMSLKGIKQALKDAGCQFDFIGFDACLMATVENGIMLSEFADYLIASEETEPGVGWYYTNWLSKLSDNSSMNTVEIGKLIADDFVSVCNQKCTGQKTTLSVTDLAELSATVPATLKSFSASTLDLLQNKQYQTVANARNSAREFAVSSKIDQVDLVSLASNLKTEEGEKISQAILGAVKYNKTSSNMTNAYGLSIYFPSKKISRVATAVADYDSIGMDASYGECIRRYASLEMSGQAMSGGQSSPMGSLLGNTGSTSTTQSYDDSEMISTLLLQLMGGNTGNITGLTSSGSSFLGKALDPEEDAQYLSKHRFPEEKLVWSKDSHGEKVLSLSEEDWKLVTDLNLSVYVDDGEGYIDLGLDNVYSVNKDGALSGTYDQTWLAINNQPIAYYHTDSMDDGDIYHISGYVPAMLNNERVNLILVFDNEHPKGMIAGIEAVYKDGETETVAKKEIELQDGDVIDFICDYYSYDGEYQDSYYLGDPLTVSGELEISDVVMENEKTSAMYRFTDLYQQNYWTPVMNQ